jgi:hypothetical protein
LKTFLLTILRQKHLKGHNREKRFLCRPVIFAKEGVFLLSGIGALGFSGHVCVCVAGISLWPKKQRAPGHRKKRPISWAHISISVSIKSCSAREETLFIPESSGAWLWGVYICE